MDRTHCKDEYKKDGLTSGCSHVIECQKEMVCGKKSTWIEEIRTHTFLALVHD